MAYDVVGINQFEKDLYQNVAEEHRNTVRRRVQALDTNRTGAKLSGPLNEAREITVLQQYVVTYLEKPNEEKVVVLGVRSRRKQRI